MNVIVKLCETEKQTTMTNTEVTTQEISEIVKGEYDLIKGEFSPEDALEIINHLIAKKISFHQLKNFSNEIRFGTVDEKSVTRCTELKQCSAAITDLIQQAEKQGKNLNIKSTISIELV